MKTKKPNLVQESLKFLLVLGLIAAFFAPGASAIAQASPMAIKTDGISAPLAPGLSWSDLGTAERAVFVNGDTVTLSGNAYHAIEEFNLDGRDDIASYYSSTGLAQQGLVKVSTLPHPNGVTSLYFSPEGYFVSIEFVGCKDDPALACLTVWQSVSTDVAPNASASPVQSAIGTLGKTAPANAATGVNTSVSLTWSAYTGTNFNHYRYCIDKVSNSVCDASGGWTSVWSGTSVALTNLALNTVYYWQVEAVLDDSTKVGANSDTWWSFTTRSSTATPTFTPPPSPPGAFSKTLPVNAALPAQSITPTLAWGASTYAASYSYCVDTINNNTCDTNWISNGASTYVNLLSGIAPGVTYYWQVRAINGNGVVDGNSGTWWTFSTVAGPANDAVGTAATMTSTVPQTISLSTTAATVDGGTANSCSTGLGFASVWYKYVATSNRRLYIDTLGTNYNTFIAVWTKNPDESLSLKSCNDDAFGTTQSALTLSVTNTFTYYIQIAQKDPGTTPTTAPGGLMKFHVKNFADVPGSSVFWPYIEGIFAANITGGCASSPDLLYCPSTNVTRAEMAVFILRGEHGALYAPPAVGTSTGFVDVPVSHPQAAWIKQLAAEGITGGCGGGYYCPSSPVTRAQMAIFLLRGKNGVAFIPPSAGASTGFADVLTSYWAADWIKELAAEGITGGCDAVPNYCPESNVTREQMAVFLSRAFSITPLP